MIGIIISLIWATTSWAWVWNSPYPAIESNQAILYGSFPESPKTLDPATAYNVNEALFIEQVDEPLLDYHYFKRPYQLEPLIAANMPEVRYYRQDGTLILDPDSEPVAYSIYTLTIKPGILYQQHPAFAKRPDGQYRYVNLSQQFLREQGINTLFDFPELGRRELVVDDFIYEIKRLADPHLNSPIYGVMQAYIVGLRELNEQLSSVSAKHWIDLRNYPLTGVRKINDVSFEIQIKGRYQPFLYWLAMHFFSPVPWEVDRFYAEPGMQERNIGFDWNPVGTGPFMLTENNPNRRMVLEKNPNYRRVFFPEDGSPHDRQLGYMQHAGQQLPLIDKAIYTLEKEAIPRWNKFLQGYYDVSTVSADSYDQAIRLNRAGEDVLTPEMQQKKITMTQTVEPAIFYTGFNMLDPLVGGSSERARLLRLAISLAVNTEESIALFNNGRGRVAHGPIPPGLFGSQVYPSQLNTWLYVKHQHHTARHSIKVAKTWLRLAGYPGGIDPKTHHPLMIRYDVSASGGPDERSQLEWMRKQFRRIGLSLNVVATQYNRFQEKMRTGNAQIFSWGWKADYPDPENFLFLLYGPNGRVHAGGENAANYENAEFDQLFNEMKNRKNDAVRASLIEKMIQLVQHDAPWIWGFFSETVILRQQWVSQLKPNTMTLNTLKYVAIDVPLRQKMRLQWNQAVFWPIGVLVLIVLLFLLPLLLVYRSQERRVVLRFKD
ncbi:MAG: ABC transporter substrate-binding protein [Gammaproteobacteria bacterium]|nr:ABC transporter substrate-binding protein [Gammaproteobacteria bacterium]